MKTYHSYLMSHTRGVARNLLRGDKPGGLGDGSPPAGPGAEPRCGSGGEAPETNVDKKNKQTTIMRQQRLVSYVILETTKSAKSTNCISGLESRNVTSWLHALTTDSGKWLDVYRRRPQGLELDLLEYGNPTQHQRGRDKKLTYGDGGQKCKTAVYPAESHFALRKSATKFLCVKTVSGKVVRHSFAYLSINDWWGTSYMCWPVF